MNYPIKRTLYLLLAITLIIIGCDKLVDPDSQDLSQNNGGVILKPQPLVKDGDRYIIDFEEFQPGEVVDEIDLGADGKVLVSGSHSTSGSDNVAIVFNSSAPTGEDFDLGSPNGVAVGGGPGVGSGGESGEFINDIVLSKILILAEDMVDDDPADGLIDDPDDSGDLNGLMAFDFTGVGDGWATVIAGMVIDVEHSEQVPNIIFHLRDASTVEFTYPSTGDNGLYKGDTFIEAHPFGIPEVELMEVYFHGSGGLDNFIITPKNCTGSIGDFVWNDLNEDGIQDQGEPGLAGVTVYLKDFTETVLATTTTDAEGFYLFEGLCAGKYKVSVDTTTLPVILAKVLDTVTSNWVASPVKAGTSRALDSNNNPARVMLADGQDKSAVDFGFFIDTITARSCYLAIEKHTNDVDADLPADAPKLDIGSTVTWKYYVTNTGDTSGDPDAAVIAGADIVVTDDQGVVPVLDASTDVGSDGMLSPGETWTYEATGTVADLDGGVYENVGTVNALVVGSEEDTTYCDAFDLSHYKNCDSSIGDFVWHDLDCNGIQDQGEPGLEGVTVYLKNFAGTVLATTTTNSSGWYEFADLCAGKYKVEVDNATLPAGNTWIPTAVKAGTDRALDSNNNPASVVLADGQVKTAVDFGYCIDCNGSIGDFVWHDLDCNGIQDQGEPGLDGVTVYLKDPSGAVLATTTTNSSGWYEFADLCAGDYYVLVDNTTLPAGTDWIPTAVKAGTDRALDSNNNPAHVLLTDGQVKTAVDFGYCEEIIAKTCYIDIEKHTNGVDADLEGSAPELVPGSTITWTYYVTNTGGNPDDGDIVGTDIIVTDDQGVVPVFDPTSDVGSDGILSVGETWTYEATGTAIDLGGGVYENVGTVNAVVYNSVQEPFYCDAFDLSHYVNPEEECGPCVSQFTEMTFVYLGSTPATVTAVTNKPPGSTPTVFDDTVAPGEQFTIYGVWLHGGRYTLGTETWLNVGGVLNATFHTSCSDAAVIPGLERGLFRIISIYDAGGAVCEGPEPS